MDRNFLNNVFCGDFEDSDEELEITTIACMEEEQLNKEKQSRRHRGSVQGHREVRMQRSLFLHIQYAVEAHDPYFIQKTDALGILGLSSLPKITVVMRMLDYGVAVDYVDEYVRIGESTAIESLKKFVQAVVAIFSDEYLRPLNNDDTTRLLAVGENRGSLGCWGALTNGLLYLLISLMGAVVNYSVNGNDYAIAQESARKDVERAFGVLQAQFAIVRGPARFWKCETLKDIMKACIIMHNMIVEDERDVNGAEEFKPPCTSIAQAYD
ncbi:hypothetical protein HHK36_009477 [Tetracentron sinense]|uniref:Nuclease HARBI1 n=1 Tax=Tetracentron sinense TaxID=13715 RepID=A0A834ZFK4_TETSI|nr:hypothetical protein HHK36_009477 [Tetracentron sinense]